MKAVKNIFQYDNYRHYLKDVYTGLKVADSKFSFRYFSKMIGSKSPSFIKHVIDGHRNLTAKHVESLIRGLRLNEEEGFYFRNLVQLNQAKTVEERQTFARKILQSKTYKKLYPLNPAQYDFFSKWYFVPIREMVGLPGFKEKPQWISEQLNFKVSPPEVKQALSEMMKLGLLKRNSDGRLVQSESHITTVDSVVSSALARSHQDLIKLGSESIDKIPRNQREILGVTFALSQQNFDKVKEKVAQFRRELVEFLASEENADAIYQFHLLLFPLAQVTEKKGSEE